MAESTRQEMIEAVRVEIMLLEARPTTARRHLAAFRAVLREIEAGGWRPIESYTPPLDPSNALIAGQYPNGLWYVEESFWRRDTGGHFSGRLLDPPTHWQPLPSPPGTSDGGEG
jgi:hypothetical protein